MQIFPADLSTEQIYKLMTGAVVPRPIAWVSTCSDAGVANLAPFSSFTFVCHDPPMLAIGIDQKAGGLKDTGCNILHSGEFVVHIADRGLLEPLHASAAEFPAEVSEVELLRLHTTPSICVRPPRISEAPISLECRLYQCIERGRQPARLMIGEVLCFHVRDDLLQGGKIDTMALNPICRLAGPN